MWNMMAVVLIAVFSIAPVFAESDAEKEYARLSREFAQNEQVRASQAAFWGVVGPLLVVAGIAMLIGGIVWLSSVDKSQFYRRNQYGVREYSSWEEKNAEEGSQHLAGCLGALGLIALVVGLAASCSVYQ